MAPACAELWTACAAAGRRSKSHYKLWGQIRIIIAFSALVRAILIWSGAGENILNIAQCVY
jgi:hypothetical protein